MKRRPEKAGIKLGESINEVIHLMYQNRTAIWFLWGLLTVIVTVFAKRHKEYGKNVIPEEWIKKLKGEIK